MMVLSWQPEALIVAVEDDGGEVPAPMPVPGSGAGLQGMRSGSPRWAARSARRQGSGFQVRPASRG